VVLTRGARLALSVALLTIALFTSSSFAASGDPVLRSASQSRRHIVVTFTIGDLRPWLIEVALSRATDASGAFPAGAVRLREQVRARADPMTGFVRWRTLKTLPARDYYVEVSGIESDGVTDCLVQQRNCLVRWSNVRRVRVR
jgi:hypothetical protein